jgi:DNA-binding MarR family transcriptional regulator
VKNVYFETIVLIERLHRLFLSVIDAELNHLGIKDITNIQCFVMYNIGKDKISVGEIGNRGYYLGSNVTYNLKKMVDNGYVIQESSPHDKRSSNVHLSPKGLDLFKKLEIVFERHSENLAHNKIGELELKNMKAQMQQLESFWNFIMMHKGR